MKRGDGPERAVGIAATALAALGGLVLAALMVLTAAEVVARYGFNAPIEGVFDLTQLGMVLITFFGLAYCAFERGHVAIELIDGMLSVSGRRRLGRLVDLLGAALFAVIGWQAVSQSALVRMLNESSALLLIPFYPFLWCVALGAFAFAAVMLVRVFRPDLGAPERR